MIKLKAVLAQAPDMEAFNRTIQQQVERFAPFAIKAADRVTSGWKGERPKWATNKRGTNQYLYQLNLVLANPESKGAKKWVWLDEGTPPHPIVPVNAPRLVFNAHYSPGSTPGSLRTFRGESKGPRVFAVAVMHPGIKPRGWSVLLQKELQRQFEGWMGPVVKNAAKASGHAL